jgi:hypothetical protein
MTGDCAVVEKKLTARDPKTRMSIQAIPRPIISKRLNQWEVNKSQAAFKKSAW